MDIKLGHLGICISLGIRYLNSLYCLLFPKAGFDFNQEEALPSLAEHYETQRWLNQQTFH